MYEIMPTENKIWVLVLSHGINKYQKPTAYLGRFIWFMTSRVRFFILKTPHKHHNSSVANKKYLRWVTQNPKN